MTDAAVTDADVAELVELMAEAAQAFMGGNMRRYVALMNHADDFTLMPPEGGETVRGFDSSDENIAGMERFFKSGEAELDVVHEYHSGKLVVLVAIERQHGLVGDYPDQEWPLRVTLVFRREGPEWQLVHRHADALVHRISFDHLSELARGLHS
jgi:ketosteroid isomerase-like protein